MNPPYPILLWFVTGALLFSLELFAPAFVLFFFGVGAWVAAVAVWLFPLELVWQLAIFLASSLLSLFLLRRTLRGVFRGNRAHNAAPTAPSPTISAAVGALAEVIEAIEPPLEGQIKFQGSFWRAVSGTAIAAGEKARIISQNGLVMHVEAVQPDTFKTMEA